MAARPPSRASTIEPAGCQPVVAGDSDGALDGPPEGAGDLDGGTALGCADGSGLADGVEPPQAATSTTSDAMSVIRRAMAVFIASDATASPSQWVWTNVSRSTAECWQRHEPLRVLPHQDAR
jgi:hypothetical protein